MDPNKTLQTLNLYVMLLKTQSMDSQSYKEAEPKARYYANTLESWLSNGGFEPNWDMYPNATAYYKNRQEYAQLHFAQRR